MAEIDLAGLDACVERQLQRWTVPGAVVGIWREGEETLRAYGVANLDVGWPTRSDMRFRVASISKVFAATLAMTLVDDGLLDLDTPVVKYLPELELSDADAREQITMRQLLSHMSGLYGDFSADFGLGDDAMMRALSIFPTLPQQTRPGEIWAYCNSGFQLAGIVIAKILGQTYDDAMAERVFGPAGLTTTCFAAHDTFGWPTAMGHVQTGPDSDEHVVVGQYYPRNRRPAGGVISTATDLLRFARLHMNDGEIDGRRILSADAARQMQTPQARGGDWNNSWGVGWNLQPIDGVATIGHNGSISGFESLLHAIPEQQTAFVVLTNSGRGSAAYPAIDEWLLEYVSGLHAAPPATTTLAQSDRAKLAGRYVRPGYDIRVSVTDDGLRIDYSAPHPLSGESVAYPAQELSPVSATEFLLRNGPHENGRVEFILGDNGTPRFVRMGGRLAGRVA
jgi:CubicO group peptidase (beta-lactamase class C family)